MCKMLLLTSCCSSSLSSYSKQTEKCTVLEKYIQTIQSDTTLSSYLPISAEVQNQTTLLSDCKNKIKFFYAFYEKYETNKDFLSDSIFDFTQLMEYSNIKDSLDYEEKMVCIKQAPLFIEYKKSKNKNLFLEKLYKTRSFPLTFQIEHLTTKNCLDTTFFLYEMLSEIDDLSIDGGGHGHLYILDKEEEFFKKIRKAKLND